MHVSTSSEQVRTLNVRTREDYDKAEDSRMISSQLWKKSVYTRKEKSTGACSELLENTGKKNGNLEVPD